MQKQSSSFRRQQKSCARQLHRTKQMLSNPKQARLDTKKSTGRKAAIGGCVGMRQDKRTTAQEGTGKEKPTHPRGGGNGITEAEIRNKAFPGETEGMDI